MEKTNLKMALLDLQNRLQSEKNWVPGKWLPEMEGQPSPAIMQVPTTQPLIDFAHFLNTHPPVAEMLSRYGLEWESPEVPLVETSSVSAIDLDDPFAGEVLGPACRLDNPDCESCQ